MPIKISQQGATTIVQIEGRLDTTSYSAFEAEALALLNNGSGVFVFDCAALSYVSSAGLRAMLVPAQALAGRGPSPAALPSAANRVPSLRNLWLYRHL